MNRELILLACILGFIAGCKKEAQQSPPSYTMVVANGALGVTALTNFANSSTVSYGNRVIYFVPTNKEVKVGMVQSSNTIIYNQINSFQKGIYTLFVIGDSTNPQAIFKEENEIPFIPNDKTYKVSDSVVNVRFINLSPNSVPLKIKISTATSNEADALVYKEMTTWRPLKAGPAATITYSIQIRNAATDALLTTYSFAANATNRFKNVTLMIRGKQGLTTGTNAFGVTPINYF